MKGKSLVVLLLSLMIIAGGLVVAFIGVGSNGVGSAKDINLGLDLAGGVSITYTTIKEEPTDQEMNDTIYKLNQRITGSGYTEGEVYREGNRRINVDIPNVSDPNKVLEELGKPGDLKFVDSDGVVAITGSDVKDANAASNPDGFGYVVILDLNASGRDKFAVATTNNINKPINIVYNGETIMSPTVSTAITDGVATISGMGTIDEANELATFIRIGALPLELEELRSNVVGAKMGKDAIDTSVRAGLIGIALIFAFMIIYYRLPGLASVLALAFYAALVIIVLSLTNMTLTLPGIAGMILSVGMAVDANVIIFSRIREELEVGKTLRASVSAGFRKARTAIVDGNVTTLIAAAVLYIMGTGTIRGFSQTLALGIVISMFTALVVTRIIVVGFVELGATNKALYGRDYHVKVFDIVKRRKIWFSVSLALILIGFVMLPIHKGTEDSILNYDIEFMGGTSTLVTTNEVVYDTLEELQEGVRGLVVEATGDETPQMNIVRGVDGAGQFVIKTKELDTETGMALREALMNKFSITAANIESENISATISTEMRRDAIIAVIIASIGILFYVSLRFHDFRFGIAAVIALVHDVLIVFTVYSVLYIPINNSFIAAMLTIVGYSINDTIVLFDRVRDNQKTMKHGDYHGVINTSISQTISRSINTSLTTFIMVFVLNLLGVASIREFALPLMVGIISGTYSSIFIASPLWYVMKKKEEAKIQNAQA
jgi:SecD/SecF fusion protein